MSVHAPGRSKLGGIHRPRTGVARAIHRALPSSALGSHGGRGRRGLTAGLSLTSMIDFLVVTTVFLLMTFSASDLAEARGLRDIPPAFNVQDVIDAPLVSVRRDAVLVDGAVVASDGELTAFSAQGRVTRLDGLFASLKRKHDLARQLQPGKEAPTHVILAIEGDVPAAVVKSVVMTAARSGYPQIDFMVHAAPKG